MFLPIATPLRSWVFVGGDVAEAFGHRTEK